MKIIVTGSEGNIGTRLCPYLAACGHTVFRVDILQRYADDYTMSDVARPEELRRLAAAVHPDAIIHLAAMVSRVTCERSPAMTIDVNLCGVNNVAQICLEHNARLIYFSTSEVYGNIGGVLSEDREDLAPNNRYGLSKLLGERLVEYEMFNHELDAITIRPFMLYDEAETFGENRSAMIRFAEGLLTGQKITVHAGSWRSWLHVSDAVEIIEKTLSLDCPFTLLNIGHPIVASMQHLARLMCDATGRDYDQAVEIAPLPTRMTLSKTPDLTRQKELLGRDPKVTLVEGAVRVIKTVRERLGK